MGSGECARCERERAKQGSPWISWQAALFALWAVGFTHAAWPHAPVRTVVTAQPSAVTSVVGSGVSVTCDPVPGTREVACRTVSAVTAPSELACQGISIGDTCLDPEITQGTPIGQKCERTDGGFRCSAGNGSWWTETFSQSESRWEKK